MRIPKFWILFIVIVFQSVVVKANSLPVVGIDNGISKELAISRKKELKEIHYSLFFRIPDSLKANICGEESIEFYCSGTSDVIIDFKADRSQIKKIAANGKVIKSLLKDEHIIIPYANLKKGKNRIDLSFIAGNKSLNRNPDYLYTLFVPEKARTIFPCFDQPDMKAHFTLTLDIPATWLAVSNTNIAKQVNKNSRRILSFATTNPLPTYLFSFATGIFKTKTCNRNGHAVTAYYRETDSAKVSQFDKIFDEVFLSLEWLKTYTNMPVPFPKYDFVILPGFQFGGMEHPGAILYNDKEMFLSQHPTPDEELRRMELIAHETSHLWFGDLVTMKWFNDVWTKEVFANYMASKIAKEQFPLINHKLNFLKSYQIYALTDDRTKGTHPIQQQLNNLQDAGLLYGNIIYDKAPVMMRKLEQQMGADSFRNGLRKYLKRYAYSNATWDDLIDILDNENPKAKVKEFSDVWVKQKGMPEITCKVVNDTLFVSQYDSYKRNICWKQRFSIGLVSGDSIMPVEINMQHSTVHLPLAVHPDYIIPNYDGMGYGRFIVDSTSTSYQLNHWMNFKDDLVRESVLMNIYENYLAHQISSDSCMYSLLKGLDVEKNQLIASTCSGYIASVCFKMEGKSRQYAEKKMWEISRNHPIVACRQQMFRSLIRIATDTTIVNKLYTIWKEQSNTLLNEDDYMSLSYQLALRIPSQYKDILNIQRNRLTSADRKREFDFVSRGCTPDRQEQVAIFNSLLKKENRSIEPWTEQLLELLNHPLREPFSNYYITPGLDVVQEIQRTGDIFFTKGWLVSLLSGHKSEEARQMVLLFLQEHPSYPIALKNKVLQAAYSLLN